MRVLFVTNEYPSEEKPWEGTAVQVQAEGLRRLGVTVQVLLLDRRGTGRKVYLFAYRRIRRIFGKVGFDLLHIHFGGIQAILGALVARRRCIVTYHGSDLHGGRPEGPAEKLAYSAGVLCSKLAATLSGASIAVSKTLLPFLCKWSDRLAVIPTGVDYDRFNPLDRNEARRILRLSEDIPYILFSDNNADPVKRMDLANRALTHLKATHPRAELLILKHVPFDRVHLYLNAADVLLVTSDKEGSPNIVKEALACNTPVVSVDVGDVSEMISAVKRCHVVPRDPGHISRGLETVLSSAERSDGREKGRWLIDNNRVCQRVLEVYTSLLNPNDCGERRIP